MSRAHCVGMLLTGLALCGAAVAAPPKGAPGRWSALVPVHEDARQFFVAPDGKPDAPGTEAAPWDLATALAGPKSVKPGDIVWLRGGTYGKGRDTLFRCNLQGTEERPIFLRQYPGERATVDGGIEAGGAWVWFWGFEITNSSPERKCLGKDRPHGLNLTSRGHKAVNLVVHDAGHPGIGFWVGVGDQGEIHGCLLYHNGLYDMGDARFPNGWTRGSPIYAQNKDGTRYITDVIAFRNFTTGMKAYTEGGFANGFHFEGNVTFDSPDWNLFGSGKKNPMERLKVLNNMTYRRPDDPVRDSVQFGYYDSQNLDAVVKDNYFVLGQGGDRAFFLKQWKDLEVVGNVLIGRGTLVHWVPGLPGGKIVWDGNTYVGDTAKAFMFNQDTLDFEGWQRATGFDRRSRYVREAPKGQHVFIRPNKYEPGRGHIVVFNWNHEKTVSVDLARILKPGERCEIRDAQNFFGEPLLAGVYQGTPVTLPLELKQVAPFVGNVTHMKPPVHTAPEFAVFVVLPVD